MINLNTFQTIILKFYILPILIVGFIFSYNTTYTISKFFVDDSITINKSTKEIKEIQRRNILLNGVELKKWTTLTQNQKDYFLNNKKEELENSSKFKLKYETITKQEKLIDNMDNYNFFYFLKVLLNNFKFGIILLFCIPFYFLYVFYKILLLFHSIKFYNHLEHINIHLALFLHYILYFYVYHLILMLYLFDYLLFVIFHFDCYIDIHLDLMTSSILMIYNLF